MEDRRHFQAIIVGGGIAGASLAYFLAERGMTDVVLFEREAQPGYHATGRSAATLVEFDPIPSLRELKVRSAEFLRNPPPGFTEHRLLDRVGILIVFQEPVWGTVRMMLPLLEAQGIAVEPLSPRQVADRIPVLEQQYFDGAVFLPDDGHIDVHELLWSYLRHASRRGVRRRCGVEVTGVRVESGRCRGVLTNVGEFDAHWVINAAGAWVGRIAAMAGAAPIRFTPYRRTVVTFGAPDDLDVRGWPLVANEARGLYFKPESSGLLASPMDEDPTDPCDVQPSDVVVAETIERVKQLAPPLVPKALRRTWAGLRTFAPDRVLVVGEDPTVKGFFWLAGQGGCGIETSPAVGEIAADLLLEGRTARVDAALLAPTRSMTG
jgi:D-arginine dehydrogenase